MEGADDFSTTIPMEVLPRLLNLGRQYGFDPLSSVEMEAYFVAALAQNSIEELETEVLPVSFLSLAGVPSWLQSCEWPLSEAGPLVFLGQFAVPSNSFIPGQTSVFIFCDRETGTIQTVVQRIGYVP